MKWLSVIALAIIVVVSGCTPLPDTISISFSNSNLASTPTARPPESYMGYKPHPTPAIDNGYDFCSNIPTVEWEESVEALRALEEEPCNYLNGITQKTVKDKYFPIQHVQK